jgi:hypothetical protein
MGSPGSAFSPDAYPTRPGETFDPRWLQTPATLNRTRLAALPNAEPTWIGRTAFELLGLDALKQLPSQEAPGVFGKRLGHLVATLHHGEIDAAASPWRQAYLRFWSTVQEVWLGGGVAAALGQPFLTAAQCEATSLGVNAVTLRLAEHPAELPLIGAARSNLSAAGKAVVLDCGHTGIKRGVAEYAGDALLRLRVLPSVPAPADGEHAPEAVEQVIESLMREVPEADSEVVASVASYVNPDGTLAESHSRYALLRANATLKLGHDGTLAARGVQSNVERAAVIMLGTALGVGFRPAPEALRPLKPEFQVRVLRAT